jgi:PIN domain nuclease of toxin-antitoxin system
MIVLDTHTWIWFISRPEVLSKQATKALSAAVKEKSVLISSIKTIW